ncbi:hypothetical protein A3I53_04050 [Candidatus Curtissbacteria bacterium RIFCSPLOWO2_02_FULL_40_13b]|uniref:Uncharacterized protein n=2 Tax=Candidatus Curtissiibacteriota TaxID=1752717 RepID=A0A1F5HP39_9BACT|nr:MAG: hypothetical protein A3F45_00380 [Candidatus Curtissbacteria bacterium RIFCSPHIGHO2_12_FULL_41_17]OGE05938.1 MAG: hypothetical protein A3I53_04050 [Candidatus Curtissbacteria bacterium RIFCSPLOWO2_02_FULL_40_13b]
MKLSNTFLGGKMQQMPIKAERWVPNFLPGSSTEKIMDIIWANPKASQMKAEFLQVWLDVYKAGQGLDHIDVVELRDYAMFASRGDPNPVRSAVSRHVMLLANQLIAEHHNVL